MGYRFKIFIKKHNQSGTYGVELPSNLRLTRPARNSMNLECSSHDSILKYVFVTRIARMHHNRSCYRGFLKTTFNNTFHLISHSHLVEKKRTLSCPKQRSFLKRFPSKVEHIELNERGPLFLEQPTISPAPLLFFKQSLRILRRVSLRIRLIH